MIETLANGYSSENTQQELSNEYKHNQVSMVFKSLCIIVLRMKVANIAVLSALTFLLFIFNMHT